MLFPLSFGSEIKTVQKITPSEFDAFHCEMVSQVQYKNYAITFPDKRWASVFLGNGEEKAVFCVCDHENRVFALEMIDQRSYLDGRFVGGTYFYQVHASGLNYVKFHPDSFIGLTFTGLVKAREFVYGYEWARFQFSPARRSWLDGFLTNWFQSLFAGHFNEYRSRYKDVHERNVMFEIRDRNVSGVPALIRDWAGKLQIVRIGVRPIDVR